eukprot:6181307-Pleurochrysis_carterae.AAC.4
MKRVSSVLGWVRGWGSEGTKGRSSFLVASALKASKPPRRSAYRLKHGGCDRQTVFVDMAWLACNASFAQPLTPKQEPETHSCTNFGLTSKDEDAIKVNGQSLTFLSVSSAVLLCNTPLDRASASQRTGMLCQLLLAVQRTLTYIASTAACLRAIFGCRNVPLLTFNKDATSSLFVLLRLLSVMCERIGSSSLDLMSVMLANVAAYG